MVYSMFLRNYTPKTNMEPENHLIEKENHLNHPPPWLWVLSRTFRFCLASCFAATGDVEDARLDCYSVVVIFQKFCTTWDKHTHYCWWQPEIWKTHQLRVVASWNPPCFFSGLMHTVWFFGISEPSTVVVTALYNKITPQIRLLVWIWRCFHRFGFLWLFPTSNGSLWWVH